MRLPQVLLVASAAAGALSVIAALVSAWQASLPGGVVALAALLAYTIAAGPVAAPRVRWGLAVGIGLLAAVMAARLFWYPEQTAGFGWLAPFYGPLDTANGPAQGKAALLDQWQRVINRERLVAVGQLLAVLCFAVAVRALPTRDRPERALPIAILALLLLATVGANVWSRGASGRMTDLLATAWPALLATVIAVGVAILSGWRAQGTWLLPVGALLVALAAVASVDGVLSAWSSSRTIADVGEIDTMAIAVSRVGLPDLSAAMMTLVALCGPALFTIGTLRTSRDISAVHR